MVLGDRAPAPPRVQDRLEVVWPISYRRHHGFIGPAWLIQLQRPGVYWLNAYRLELEYMLAHTPAAPIK